MLLVYFSFADPIAWRLGGDDPAFFPLQGAGDWSLVNPLYYLELPVPALERNPPIEVSQGKYFWVNSEIVLATENNQTIQDQKSGSQQFSTQIVGELLVRLRHISGQATLPHTESCISGGYTEIFELPSLAANGSSPVVLGRSRFQKYLWVTSITAERIKAAIALGPRFVPPTHEMLFLDAIDAYRGHDHRRAILYAAISAEVAFGSIIDEAYEHILSADNDVRFRVIALPQAGGTMVHKDPIYARLRQRSDFNVLFHELSLYVLRRSLLAEDETLYAEAKRLYSTRNQLVHSGELTESESNAPYSLDERGAMTALETTGALFRWLGIRNEFPLPDGSFVSYPSEALW